MRTIIIHKCGCESQEQDNGSFVLVRCDLCSAALDLLEALKRVRQAFYVDGTSKALRAAFEGTKELVAKAEGRATA